MTWARTTTIVTGLGVTASVLLSGCQTSGPAIRGDVGAFSAHETSHAGASARTVVGPDYRIGVPDRVRVVGDGVRGVEVEEAAVDAEGFVTLPTLGRVKVSGLTTDEASEALTRRVRTLDPNATLTLTVTRYASRHVYAFGGVGAAGPVAWRPGMTLADALSEAGLSPQADLREVSVIRPGNPGDERSAPRRVTVDFARLIEAGDATVNVSLRAGDVVVVPRAEGKPAWSAWDGDGAALLAAVADTPKPESLGDVGSVPASNGQPIDVERSAAFEPTSAATWPVSNRSAASAVGAPKSPTAAGAGYFGVSEGLNAPRDAQGGVIFWN